MIRKIIYVLGILFAIMQFIRPAKNNSMDQTNSIEKKFNIPAQVKTLLINACYDCHSNNTNYAWYYYIQPVGWYIAHHVDEGKEELNFDEFNSYKVRKQDHKLEECIEMVAEDEMPLSSYTMMHAEAKLSTHQKKILINWFKEIRTQL